MLLFLVCDTLNEMTLLSYTAPFVPFGYLMFGLGRNSSSTVV
jgi:hypothetical protein